LAPLNGWSSITAWIDTAGYDSAVSDKLTVVSEAHRSSWRWKDAIGDDVDLVMQVANVSGTVQGGCGLHLEQTRIVCIVWSKRYGASEPNDALNAIGLTLPPEWASSYTCPALRPYQLGPMRVPQCNQKVTGSGHKAITAVKP